MGAALALHGCSGDPEAPTTEPRSQVASAAEDGTSTPISDLPFIDSGSNPQLVAELLARPTALGETTALHVRLPPPQNPELAGSLVSVIGETDSPQMLFRSDALAQLGVIPKSPGKDFFTAFATLPPEELETLVRNQDEIASGVFGESTSESVLFEGRAAVSRTINPAVDLKAFQIGAPIHLNGCPVRPVSTWQAWGQSLFITSPAVVQDPARTWDPCTGAGTKGGVWTFSHLMKEMSIGSGLTPSDFVKNWLSLWLNNYVVNGDILLARTAMFTQVIKPWATASGVTATLVTDPFTGVKSVNLSGPLDLDIAPFELDAIVNRIDLGETASGVSGYSGSVTSLPKTAGELRFIFGVVQPSPWGGGTQATCGKKLFTTILEYGVPGTGCAAVVSWAKKWSALQTFPGFTPAYLAQLQSMTESVVLNGAAPTKGNKNAINQIRTNEKALGSPWELREFTLTNENPAAGTNVPANGPLRKHTVALTPNDGAFSAGGADPTIDAFVHTQVVLPTATVASCATKPGYKVPFFINVPMVGMSPFRGGNSLIPPSHWRVNTITGASPQHLICARHQFSLNTCNGCHNAESGTNGLGGSTSFTHVDPLSAPPVTLSKFLTGGGPSLVFNVADPQLGAPVWQFADLERRFQRLYDLSHCTSCVTTIPMARSVIDQIQALGPVPADVPPGTQPPFPVGPITDLGVVQRLLDLRSSFAGDPRNEPANFIRPIDMSSH